MTTYKPDDADANKALERALYQHDPQAQAPDPDKPGDQGKRGFRFIHGYKNESTRFFYKGALAKKNERKEGKMNDEWLDTKGQRRQIA